MARREQFCLFWPGFVLQGTLQRATMNRIFLV